MRRRLLTFLIPLALAGCVHHVPSTADRSTASDQALLARPLPTENWLGTDAERRNRSGRKEWFEEMHRTAPGVDWREMEKANGRILMDRRRNLIQSRGPGGPHQWTERGSRNLAGRMHAVALGLDGASLYGGSSRGGVWRGSLEGEGWTPLADNLWGGAHHVAIAQGDTQVILTMTDGGSLHYSEDDGMTWLQPAGLSGGRDQGIRLLTDPTAPNRVFLLVRQSSGGPTRLYRSEDGGRNFSILRDNSTRGSDLWMNRLTGTPLFLLDGLEVLRSDDAGDSWSPVGTIPESAPGGAVLAGSEAGAPTLYAAVRPANSGPWLLYRSQDAGANWEYRNEITDFWQSMSASILDPDLVATGGVEVFRSSDGGALFVKVNGWGEYYGDPRNKLHADVPGLQVLPYGGDEIWFVSTDGGLYRSDDGLLSVRNLSLEGLGVSQYYSTHTSINDPDLILAGAQDQGYQRTSDASSAFQGFEQLISGDYGHLTSWDGSHDRVLSTYPGFILIQNGEANPQLGQIGFPSGETHMWLPMVLADPTDRDAFFFLASHLYRYEHVGGGTWDPVQAWPDPFTAGGGNTLTGMAISPADTNRRFLVNDRGSLWWSDDAGQSWNLSASVGPRNHYFYGTSIEASGRDPLLAFVGGSGYSGPAVYRTDDGGQTWVEDADGLPNTMVYGLALQGPDSDILFAATEAGPYLRDPATGLWEYIGADTAPLTTYWSVEAVPEGGVVRFGTYGRGIWDYHVTGPDVPENCFDGVDNDEDQFVDCADPDCRGIDGDGDTVEDCLDCARADGEVWAAPDPIVSLRVSRLLGAGPVLTVLEWPEDGGGTGTVFDVVAGDLNELSAGGWPANVTCLAEDDTRNVHADFRPATARWYLVRAANSCGAVDYGATSLGAARTIATGDCN